MTEVEHFAHGWLAPALAYGLSFLGCLLGLLLAGRSRAARGASRARWLTLSAIAIGGSGIWLAHFMALLGFDVPDTVVRYDISTLAIGFGLAVAVTAFGLYLVGFDRPSARKVVLAGLCTGVGLAVTNLTGPLAMRFAGEVRYEPRPALLSVGVAIVGATVTLWFTVVIRGGGASIAAALIMALAACSAHYTMMAAVAVHLDPDVTGTVGGSSLFVLLTPVSVLACLMISALAYSTVGFSVRQVTAKERALLARTREMYTAASLVRAHRSTDTTEVGS